LAALPQGEVPAIRDRVTSRKEDAMQRTLTLSHVLLLACATWCSGQELLFDQGEPAEQEPAPATSMPDLETPWEQQSSYYRYDARQLVQRNAALKAAQRRQRIAARKWLGYEPLRPPASPLPFMGSSGRWVSVGPHLVFPGRFTQSSMGPVMVVGQLPAATER
jgi:hypothetical protein